MIQSDIPDLSIETNEWPKITIITPSFNQGQFLDEAIRSVVCQNYPCLEYIVIDGGSTDNSVEIIRKYNDKITYWVSEPDRGQSHAINKGLARATGDIIGWVNSDDYLLPNCLMLIANLFKNHRKEIIAGNVEEIVTHNDVDYEVEQIVVQQGITLRNFVCYWESKYSWHQVGLFFPASVWKNIGSLDETLTYGMDYDLMCRFLQRTSVYYINETVARFRLHSNSKTVSQAHLFLDETSQVSKRYWHLFSNINIKAYRDFYVKELLRHARKRIEHGFFDGFGLIVKAIQTSPKCAICFMLNKTKKLFIK